jgi:hypothetical protein
MEARKLLDAAPFKADVIKALKQAFDEAWASAEGSRTCFV